MARCRAFGCVKNTTAFGAYCSTHGSRRRKNGHEDQRSIKTVELRPYVELVQARRERNVDNPTWPALESRWQLLVDEARGIIAAYEAGRPMIGHKKEAADEIVRLSSTARLQEVMDTALAMVVFWQLVPRSFMSDEAFRVQLVRRVIRLSPHNARTYTGSARPKRAYRELSPRVMEVLSSWLLSAVGAAGMKLAELEKRDREELAAISRDLNQGLDDLK